MTTIAVTKLEDILFRLLNAEIDIEEAVKEIEELYKPTKLVQSDEGKQYKEVTMEKILDEISKLGTVTIGDMGITIGKWVISIGRKYKAKINENNNL